MFPFSSSFSIYIHIFSVDSYILKQILKVDQIRRNLVVICKIKNKNIYSMKFFLFSSSFMINIHFFQLKLIYFEKKFTSCSHIIFIYANINTYNVLYNIILLLHIKDCILYQIYHNIPILYYIILYYIFLYIIFITQISRVVYSYTSKSIISLHF